MCVESLNTLNRASLSIKKKFNLLISLDLIRPGLSVIIISGTLYFGFIVEKEIYLFVLFVSVLAEVLICLPFVILELGKNQWEQFKISPLFKDSLLASGFSYTSTSMRKLPVVVAGSILPELSALTSIFLQFFTLINYLISSLMMQISVSLLKREIIYQAAFDMILKGSRVQKLTLVFLYTFLVLMADNTKTYWLPMIFNYQTEITFSMVAFFLLPLTTFFAQLQFYNLFSKTELLASGIILINLVVTILFGIIFLWFGSWNISYFGYMVFVYHLLVFVALFSSDCLFKLRMVKDNGGDPKYGGIQ